MVAIQITVDVKEAMGLEVRVVEIVMIMVGTLMVDKINVVEEIMVSLVVRAGVEEGRVDLEVVLVLEVADMEEEVAAAAAEEAAAEAVVVEVNVIKVKGAPS
ncbi:hypothetical protein H0E87_003240 [Populus deltoides]|uniref:Uncharacterized protein n=1 Tax=Populus deltoides TaxID=3696 RepID=A0A8T2ZYV6_POPDE|nr:hypothetical protein H0E87_003240 [Populus deltoides]